MAYISPILTLMVGAVKKISVALSRDFNELEHLQSGSHNDGMFASRSYEKAAKTLLEELSKAKPGYKVIIDDSEPLPASGNAFLVAPIDGFADFAHGNAAFAISVALLEGGNVVDAVIYSPISDELFFAERGGGAFKEGFRNHERLRVSGAKNLGKALFSCNADAGIVQKVLAVSPNLLIEGSTALALARFAGGKSDVVIGTATGKTAIAAGILVVKESGGYIFSVGETDIRTENLKKVLEEGNIVATNESLRQKVAELMAEQKKI